MSDALSNSIAEGIRILDRPIPRNVQMKSFSNAFRLWSLIIFIFLTISFASFYFLYSQAVPFLAGYWGLPSSGLVTQKYFTYLKSSKVPHIRVKYEEGLGGGQVSWDFFNEAQIGQPVQIHYFSWAPSLVSVDNSMLSGGRFWVQVVFLSIIALFVPVFLTGLFFIIHKEKFLLMNGKTAKGIVVSRFRGTVRYEFKFDNQQCKGSFGDNSFQGIYKDGDDVLVLVDPNNLKTNMAYVDKELFWEIGDGGY